jgi:hypothetical protein
MPRATQSLLYTCFIHRSVQYMFELVGIGLECSPDIVIYPTPLERSLTNLFLFAPLALRSVSVAFAFWRGFFSFALMQKETKRSRAKYASALMPSRHPAFGSGHRARLPDTIWFRFKTLGFEWLTILKHNTKLRACGIESCKGSRSLSRFFSGAYS